MPDERSSAAGTYGSAFTDERLVIPLVAPRRARLQFAAISIAAVVGCVAWIAITRSWAAIVFGGLGIAAFALVWSMIRAGTRTLGGAPAEIVATTQGLSSALWSVEWSQVRRISIGALPYSGLPVLRIEPFEPSDVAWRPLPWVLRFGARLDRAAKQAPIKILQANVDRPLQELAADFERLARRPLT